MAPRNSRKEELLAAARDRLTQEQSRKAGESGDGLGPEFRYRGQVVKRGAGGSTPGSGSISRPKQGNAASADDLRVALQRVKTLYRDGLISRAEAEKKRAEILDRL